MNTRQFIKTSALASIGLITPSVANNQKNFSTTIDGKDLLKVAGKGRVNYRNSKTFLISTLRGYESCVRTCEEIIVRITDESILKNNLTVEVLEKNSMSLINKMVISDKQGLRIKSINFLCLFQLIGLDIESDRKETMEVTHY